MRLDFVLCVSRHEYMRVCVQTLGAPIGAAALEVGDLLNTRIELRLPRILGDVDVFAIKYVFD